MIFVTVGTERYPFDRLLQYTDEALKKHNLQEPIFYQTGSCRYVPSRGECQAFLPFSQMVDHVKKATLVITHGGVGSVDLCLSLEKKPLVCPRKLKFAEAIDDHQIRYVEFMARANYILQGSNAEEIETNIVAALKYPERTLYQGRSVEKEKLILFLQSLMPQSIT